MFPDRLMLAAANLQKFLIFPCTNKAGNPHTVVIFSTEPREELVQVNELDYNELVATGNDSFRTTVSWEKPLFTHSDVKYYKYKVLATDASQRKRRGTALNTAITTVSRMVYIGYNII